MLERGEKALVFTQFREIGELLAARLAERFGDPPPLAPQRHPQHQRDTMVASFQAEGGPGIFLLGLKAGGVGLNLTAASLFLHFDRWWNPAVENQATDRAFRIGQTRNVQVREFICAGTQEEKIDGLVKAKVQGSRSAPYKVEIRLPVLGEAEWMSVEKAMAEQALFLAQLLAGEMPTEIESAFRAANLSLFPAGARELATECSCPDWANPCKHIAATYYILAEAFDQDPFLLFQWRGREPKKLQEQLAQFRTAEAVDAEPLATGMDWEPLGPERFWAAGAIPHPVPALSPRCDLLARQLGPSPVVLMGRDFADLLEELVTTAAKEARTLLES